MRIQILTASDAPAYKRIMLLAYEHAGDSFTSTPEERKQEPDAWWVNRVANPEASVSFGVFEEDRIVGTVAVEFSRKPKTKHKALVIGMYVLESRRGKGMARALMQQAIQACQEREGVQLVQLDVTEGNEPAFSLYQSLGFKQFGLEPYALHTLSGFRSKVHMWLPLPGLASAV